MIRQWMRHLCRRTLGRVALAAGLAVMGLTSVAPANAQTLLQAGARYPRVRLLPSGELIATVLLFPTDYRVRVFSSMDNGATFTPVGIVDDPEFAPKRTSSPDFIRLANGDLILGINVDTSKCATCYSKIKIYRSTDNGRNWTYLSTAATAANNQGFWEPNFSIATDGALVLLYADETSSCCSQKLVRIRSYDNGATWQDRSNMTRLASSSADSTWGLRPGMPVVSKLTDGTNRYFATYEICGQDAVNNCRTYYKTSTDGWDYGAETAMGTVMADSLGRFMTHTPVNKSLPGGPLLWLGQYMKVADGTPSGLNGTVIYKSASGSPSGPWTTIAAPVTLPAPTESGCEGFSPGLQWVNNGATIVHLTMRRNPSTNVCDVYFGTGPS